MKTTKYLVLFLISIFSLTGCKSEPNASMRQDFIDVNFYCKASAVTLKYKESGASIYTDVVMRGTENNWWNARAQISSPIRFEFTDEEGRVYNLGGTMGNYPGDPSEDFETSGGRIWVKNGLIYNYSPESKKPSNELVVLTLNMHTYQETQQNEKFERIAEAINDLNPDVVVLQECAQHKDSKIVESHYGKDIREDNMALILVNLLRQKFDKKYYFYWDWSHYGFDIYEEGTAILTKYNIDKTQSRYVSKSSEKTFWKSRNVTMIQTDVPGIGRINIFSAHMGWWGYATLFL